MESQGVVWTPPKAHSAFKREHGGVIEGDIILNKRPTARDEPCLVCLRWEQNASFQCTYQRKPKAEWCQYERKGAKPQA